MRFKLYDIASATQAVGNTWEFDNYEIKAIKTDSRLIEPGDLFVCLEGSRFDGHGFVEDALKRGAVAILGEKPLCFKKTPYLLVQNSLNALADIVKLARKRFKGKVIAITGSSGKTTVKEFLASILNMKFKVGKTFKNWNNDLGVPLSVFSFNGDEDFWILELGVSRVGDMDRLGAMVEPDIVVLLNIGISHVEGLGGVRGVLKEKIKLVDFLKPEGVVFFNEDIPELRAEILKKDIKSFGFSTRLKSKFCGKYLGVDDSGCRAELSLDGSVLEVSLKYSGEFMVENAIAAASVGYFLKVDIGDIKLGLQSAVLPEHRAHIKEYNGFIIIDDCYNANPLSTKKSIGTALDISKHKGLDLVLFLGDMKELGTFSHNEHKLLGEFVANLSIDFIFYYGEWADDFIEGYRRIKEPVFFKKINSEGEFHNYLGKLNMPKSVVLFKASRGCKLERFVKIFQEFIK